MMNDPSITCVTPTLNSDQTLETTILSLKSQRNVSLEMIVVDSGSKDGTIEICRSFGVAHSFAEPGNMYRAINAGLSQSKTRWLAYLNSDDWLYSDSFARLIEYGESQKVDVVYGNCDYVDEQGRFIYSFAAAHPAQLLSLFKLGRMGMAQPATIFRHDLYRKLDGFDETYRFKADADFFIRALKARAKFALLEGPPVACFRVHERQLSIRKRDEIEAEARRLFGADEMKPGLSDWNALARWRFKNIPQYMIRILRESSLSRRLRLPKTIESFRHD